MPELPDLEIYKRNLMKLLPGRTIAKATADYPAKVNVPGTMLNDALAGAQIADIVREGKELHYHLSNGKVFGVHLMLSGRTVLAPAAEVEPMKYKIASVYFEDGGALAFVDDARWLRVTLAPRVGKAPDALSRDFTLDYMMGLVERHKRMGVKAMLIDQKCIRGIGNAYADEILYQANISPLSVVGKIPAKALLDLYSAIPSVLGEAIEQIAAIAPDSISGEERSFLKVHNRERTHTDKNEEILYARVEDKGTYYVKSQRFYM